MRLSLVELEHCPKSMGTWTNRHVLGVLATCSLLTLAGIYGWFSKPREEQVIEMLILQSTLSLQSHWPPLFCQLSGGDNYLGMGALSQIKSLIVLDLTLF